MAKAFLDRQIAEAARAIVGHMLAPAMDGRIFIPRVSQLRALLPEPHDTSPVTAGIDGNSGFDAMERETLYQRLREIAWGLWKWLGLDFVAQGQEPSPHCALDPTWGPTLLWAAERLEAMGVAAEEPSGKKEPRRGKKRGAKPRKTKAPTPRQTEVIQIVGECKGVIAEAARRLGRHRKTIEETYKAGMKKLGKVAFYSKDKTRLLTRDRRGQENLAEGDDRRRQ